MVPVPPQHLGLRAKNGVATCGAGALLSRKRGLSTSLAVLIAHNARDPAAFLTHRDAAPCKAFLAAPSTITLLAAPIVPTQALLARILRHLAPSLECRKLVREKWRSTAPGGAARELNRGGFDIFCTGAFLYWNTTKRRPGLYRIPPKDPFDLAVVPGFGAKSHDAQHPLEYMSAERVHIPKTIWDPSKADKDAHKVPQPIASSNPSATTAQKHGNCSSKSPETNRKKVKEQAAASKMPLP
eukprot:1812987-Rhodomonas_salina.2